MSQHPTLPGSNAADGVQREIADAVARIRFGTVVVQIHDGVVVQIESTEKRRFAAPKAQAPAIAR